MIKIWRKIKKTKTCWNWLGYLTSGGYGRVEIGTRTYAAHRYVYETLVGPIPEGLQIDHLCFNRACVNPRHLEPVTPGENIRRSRQRKIANTPNCVNGHSWKENTYIVIDKKNNKKWRNCRKCKYDATVRWRMRLEVL